jgi:hypothetical protein
LSAQSIKEVPKYGCINEITPTLLKDQLKNRNIDFKKFSKFGDKQRELDDRTQAKLFHKVSRINE